MAAKHENYLEILERQIETQEIETMMQDDYFAIEDAKDFDLNTINIPHQNLADFITLSPSALQDETLDIADVNDLSLPQTIHQPITRFGPPEIGVFSGDLNFEVRVSATDVHKRKYMYSAKLNRIYVEMGNNFTIQFRWDFRRATHPMFVRALTVFSNDTQAEKRVERCLQHRHATNVSNAGLEHSTVQHVLRSTRERGAEGVYYCGVEHRPDSWYSVLVQLAASPHDGTAALSHAYQFVCKNSCSTGINRRAIAIVFTLEDETGLVHGRQSVGARVCSCVKRDLRRDEDTELSSGKRRCAAADTSEVSSTLPPPSKKLKLEAPAADDTDTVHTLPAGLQVVGSKVAAAGFNVMLSMMEHLRACKPHDARAQDKLGKSIAGIKAFLDQLSTKTT